MKEGTLVKVVASITGHEFQIGEVVKRRYGEYEEGEWLGFYSEHSGLWYMKKDEYEILDKSYVISLIAEAMNAAIDVGFSREVWEGIAAAIEQAEKEL